MTAVAGASLREEPATHSVRTFRRLSTTPTASHWCPVPTSWLWRYVTGSFDVHTNNPSAAEGE